MSLSGVQWRRLETISRFLLSILIVVFVFVAVGTYQESQEIKEEIRAGNCSYLLENDVVKEYRPGGGERSFGKNFSLPEENQVYGIR